MIENLSISDKERTDSQISRDILSELPLSIIHTILALVPIRDAVKTSLLSRQWRYTWTGLTQLVFDEQPPFRESNLTDEFKERMETFITNVLVLHNGPILRCLLSAPLGRHCRIIGAWIHYLSRNDVRELIINTGSFQDLRSSVYSCKKLFRLSLKRCDLDPPPTKFKAFLFLRILCLDEVNMPNNTVECLVANCPLLEDFRAFECLTTRMRISAPNLKFLHLHDDYTEISLNAPLLAEVTVCLEDYGFRSIYVHDSSVCNYTKFMGSLTNLVKLRGSLYFTKHLSMGIELYRHGLVFPRLKHIELNEVNFEDNKVVSVVIILISGAPNLETLKISSVFYSEEYYSRSKIPNVSNFDFGCLPIFKLEKLREVEIWDITGIPSLMKLIRLLLSSSPVLETMILDGLDSSKLDRKLRAEIDGYSRASPNVKLIYGEWFTDFPF